MLRGCAPILSCAEARALEARIFGGDEAKEWPAMQQAGRAIAREVERDFLELGGLPATAHVLVLAGKGHNGGDALIAAQALRERFPAARIDVLFVFGERALRPLAARAWRELSQAARGEGRAHAAAPLTVVRADTALGAYDLCLDGVFGFQFRAPAEPAVVALLERVNAAPIGLRAAVDLPSAGVFRADFTYATGCVKTPVLESAASGRVRYLDLGFFAGAAPSPAGMSVLTRGVLAPLAALRPAQSDKRTFGHVFLLGGSRSFPGAILMATLAALRSGAGLVTAFVPESLVPAFAARAPEAMWVGWPETPGGGLALEGEHLLRERLGRAGALVLGPGLAREAETLALVRSLVASSPVPLVLDADALQPDIVHAGAAPRVLTPHAGEWARIAGDAGGGEFAAAPRAVVVRKGARTRLCDGRQTCHSLFGGPVLARGGSGDLLAGLIGGLLAQAPGDPFAAAARGVAWHGLAADGLARAHGQTAVSITQLLDFLPAALKECAHEP